MLVVVVNYRTADLTIDALKSLAGEAGALPGLRVEVVENASGDDSACRIAAAIKGNGWAPWVSLRLLGDNGGFAAGNNAALRPALESADPPEYLLLLNPDTVVRAGAVSALVAFLQGRPEIGIVGSRLEGPDGTAQRSAFRFHSILGELENGLRFGPASRLLRRWIVAPPVPSSPCRVDWVSGACMLVRRSVFEAIGLLDEGYFLYFEEADFCRRAHRAGWSCWYLPTARVVHLVGQSSGINRPATPRARRPGYWFESRRRYFRRFLGPTRAALADLSWALGFSSFRLRQALRRKPDDTPPRLLNDFLRHNYSRKTRKRSLHDA
jgi:hypothetical protein